MVPRIPVGIYRYVFQSMALINFRRTGTLSLNINLPKPKNACIETVILTFMTFETIFPLKGGI